MAQVGRARLGAHDEFGEGETLGNLRARLLEGGHAEGEVDKLCTGLCVFPEASRGLPLWKAAAREQDDDVDDGAGPPDGSAPGAHGGSLAERAVSLLERSAGSASDRMQQFGGDPAADRKAERASGSTPRLPHDAKGFVVSISVDDSSSTDSDNL